MGPKEEALIKYVEIHGYTQDDITALELLAHNGFSREMAAGILRSAMRVAAEYGMPTSETIKQVVKVRHVAGMQAQARNIYTQPMPEFDYRWVNLA